MLELFHIKKSGLIMGVLRKSINIRAIFSQYYYWHTFPFSLLIRQNIFLKNLVDIVKSKSETVVFVGIIWCSCRVQAGPGLQRLNYCLLIVQQHEPSQEWNSSLSEIKGLMLQKLARQIPGCRVNTEPGEDVQHDLIISGGA